MLRPRGSQMQNNPPHNHDEDDDDTANNKGNNNNNNKTEEENLTGSSWLTLFQPLAHQRWDPSIPPGGLDSHRDPGWMDSGLRID